MEMRLLAFVAMALLAAGVAAAGNNGESNEGPAVIAAVAPARHPPIAQSAGARGEVIIEVQVDADGNVLSTKTLSGHHFLQKISEEAAKQWKFASLQGSPKERAVQLTFGYRQVDKGPNPKNDFTTVFLPPYKVEVQAHPKIIH